VPALHFDGLGVSGQGVGAKVAFALSRPILEEAPQPRAELFEVVHIGGEGVVAPYRDAPVGLDKVAFFGRAADFGGVSLAARIERDRDVGNLEQPAAEKFKADLAQDDAPLGA
jgi:hypothetical protein